MSCVWSGGHGTSILCAGVSCESERLVATGAEGGELTLWSHDGSPVSKLHMSPDDDVTCVAFSPSAPCMLYASYGRTVAVLDTRNLKSAVAELADAGEEEINCVSVNEAGSLLAAADDSGAVRIIDVQQEKVIRTLRKHDNICSSVTFRPHRPQSLVSAGLDMQVSLWNLPKVRPLWTYSLQDTQEKDAHPQKAGQMFNPPLAHCIDVTSCGDVFACAAEDGYVHLLRVSEDSRLRERGMFKAHSQGASQARFINFLSQPYWLATGGNDGLVALWDISGDDLLARKSKGHKKRHKGRAKKKPEAQETDKNLKQQTKSEEEEASSSSCSSETACGKNEPKLTFQHGEKVNWICPAVLKGKPSLLVVDQRPSPTVYSLDQL
ncbi:WD repeat-containing protein 53 [Danio aesculapii]|uniref:WD repeat-containing protein 53 n=1 Tax=Danio aesculapii TaxID=1142201 RepID=UPI0024C09A84|nr:WD repeat-containing protein 53 [Danio aesculapii]XP_056329748.1 WD repeat-containing protein 53 [Danio aesculapii]